jgi:hypothetical protein
MFIKTQAENGRSLIHWANGNGHKDPKKLHSNKSGMTSIVSKDTVNSSLKEQFWKVSFWLRILDPTALLKMNICSKILDA